MKFNSSFYKQLIKKYKTCPPEQVYLLLEYLNQIGFIKELREDDGFSVAQINNLFDILVKRAIELGEQLPDGYMDLYGYAEEKGWIK